MWNNIVFIYWKEIKDDFFAIFASIEIVCIWLLAQNDNWAVIYD